MHIERPFLVCSCVLQPSLQGRRDGKRPTHLTHLPVETAPITAVGKSQVHGSRVITGTPAYMGSAWVFHERFSHIRGKLPALRPNVWSCSQGTELPASKESTHFPFTQSCCQTWLETYVLTGLSQPTLPKGMGQEAVKGESGVCSLEAPRGNETSKTGKKSWVTRVRSSRTCLWHPPRGPGIASGAGGAQSLRLAPCSQRTWRGAGTAGVAPLHKYATDSKLK